MSCDSCARNGGPGAIFMGDSTDEKQGPSGMRFVGVGISFGACTALGWFGGKWVDSRFGYEPWGATIGALLGVSLGIWDLLRVSVAVERDEKERRGLPRGMPPGT